MITRLLDWLGGETTVSRFALGCLLAAAVAAIINGLARSGGLGLVVGAFGLAAGVLTATWLARR